MNHYTTINKIYSSCKFRKFSTCLGAEMFMVNPVVCHTKEGWSSQRLGEVMWWRSTWDPSGWHCRPSRCGRTPAWSSCVQQQGRKIHRARRNKSGQPRIVICRRAELKSARQTKYQSTFIEESGVFRISLIERYVYFKSNILKNSSFFQMGWTKKISPLFRIC